jgi:hypothetical protein
MKIAAPIVAALAVALLPAAAGGSTTDEQPPRTTITAGPVGPTNVASASFMFTADEGDSHFNCALDGGGSDSCSSPATYVGLADGSHTFSVYAVKDGNQGPTATWSWTVDTVPPRQVGSLHAKVGYGKLVISWTRVGDTDHVVVFRGIGKESSSTQVFAGAGTSYVERKFVNAIEHRYAFVSFDKAGNVSGPAGLNVEPSALLLAPRDGAHLRRNHPPALRWRAIRTARFYNVQLWRGRQKLLSAWPKRASFRLGRSWMYNNRSFRLKPGTYVWYVWPAFGQKGTYGKLAGTASFDVR